MSEQQQTHPDANASARPREASADLREDVAGLASDAGDAGRQVVDVAKDETRSVAADTKVQARRLLGTVGDELRTQAAAQQSKAAAGIRSAGTELAEMASSSERSGYASQVVGEAADRVDAVGRWLGERDPKSLLEEVKGFARRRPGVFIAIAVGAGVVAGRLTRALASSGADSTGSTSAAPRNSGRETALDGASAEARFAAPPVPPVPEVATPQTQTRTVGSVGSSQSAPGYGGAR
jgi:hypothetical protein